MTFLCLLMGPLSDSYPSPHFADKVVGPSKAFGGSIREGWEDSISSSSSSEQKVQGQTWPLCRQILPHPWLIRDLCAAGLPVQVTALRADCIQLRSCPDSVISSYIQKNKGTEGQVQLSIVTLAPNRTGPYSFPSRPAVQAKEPQTPSVHSFQIFWPLHLDFYHSIHIEYVHSSTHIKPTFIENLYKIDTVLNCFLLSHLMPKLNTFI